MEQKGEIKEESRWKLDGMVNNKVFADDGGLNFLGVDSWKGERKR